MKLFFPFFLFSMVPVLLSAQYPPIPVEPRQYVCYRASNPIKIDGLMVEPDWQKAEWTEYFMDIEGSIKPKPRLKSRAKMLWDDKFLYIAAQLEEPHVWAFLKERESVIFNDPDFEVFIDPDGDTHNYLEYEMNALNTQWDLLLLKPYRDDLVNNVAIDNWNYNGIRSAVYINGTINNPKDTDKGWTLEIAFPLDALIELSATGKLPVSGEQYRINFSRVEWTLDIVSDKYRKRTHNVDGREISLPEDNWVWSPQGVIAMHQPETWGYLQFSDRTVGTETEPFIEDSDNLLKLALRKIYFREKDLKEKTGRYSADLKVLGLSEYLVNGDGFSPLIILTQSMYEATVQSKDGKSTWHIIQDGRIWETRNE
jgi:hypothetical protein